MRPADRLVETLTQAGCRGHGCQRDHTAHRQLFTKPSAEIGLERRTLASTSRPSVSDLNAAARQPAATSSGAAVPSGTSMHRCPHCGGSGQLRTGHGSYRSCLECAARGILSQRG